MPSWKKVIISGSDASLNSLNISTALTASGLNYPTVDGSAGQGIITDGNGNLSFGAVSAETGSLLVTASISGTTLTFEKGDSSTFNITLPTGGGGGGYSGLSATAHHTQSVAAETWSFSHGLGDRLPVITVFDYNEDVIIPNLISVVDENNLNIVFTTARQGYATAVIMGASSSLSATASYVEYSNVANKPTLISGSSQIASDISGSITEFSASIVSRVQDLESTDSDHESRLDTLESKTLVSSSAQTDRSWIVGANGFSDYTFSGSGLIGTENDPTLYLTRGEVYRFDIQSGGSHPFRIQSTPNGSAGTQYNDGLSGNDLTSGTLVWNVQFDSPSKLYYQCVNHGSMGGVIHILDKQPDGLVSSSLQIASDISGSFTSLSQSIASDIADIVDGTTTVGSASTALYSLDGAHAATADEAINATQLDNLQSSQFLRSDQSGTLTGDLVVTGTLTAQEFHTEFVSASILFESGSTKFGDSADDIHSFTGSVNIDGSITATSYNGIFQGALSSSAQIASDISGAFDSVSASIASDIATNDNRLDTLEGKTLLSSSAQIAEDISGSFTSLSSSIEQRFVGIEQSVSSLNSATSSYALEANISGAFTSVSSSIASDIADIIDGTQIVTSASYAITASYALNVPVTASYALTASFVDSKFISASAAAEGFGQGGVTSIIAGSGISIDQSTGDVTVTAIASSGVTGQNVIAPFAFAFVDTTSNGTGTGISWGNWNSSNYTLDFTFATAQPDTSYSVITDSETFDDYFVGITNKTTTGFRAEFYDSSQSRTPSTFSPFTFFIYGSDPIASVGVAVTGSLLTTSSLSSNTLTFTKGDSSTYDIDLTSITPTSASYAVTSSYALTASYALNVPTTASYALSAATASYVDPDFISASAAASGFGQGGVTSIIAGTGISIDQSTGDVTITATGGGGGAGFPYTGDAVITGSLYVSGGYISGSFKGDGSQLTGIDVGSVASVRDTFTNQIQVVTVHGFNSKDINVAVYDSNDKYIIPQAITLTDFNTVTVDFAVTSSGAIVISKGGHILSALGLSSKAGCVSSASFSATGSSFYYDVNFNGPFDTSNYSVNLQAHSQFSVPSSFPGHAWVDSNKSASGFRIVVPSFDSTTDQICWTAIAHGESNVTASNANTASYVEYNNVANKPTLISSSAQIASDISGSFIELSSSIASDIADIIDGTQIVASASYALTSSHGVNFSISGSFNINEYTWPTTDGTYGVEHLTTDGAGGLTWETTDKIFQTVKNISGATLQKGTPVHATGSGAGGNAIGIIAASASDASTMPATYILHQTLADEEEGLGLSAGFINGVDTSAFKEGEVVYVGPFGGYTNVKPTGSALIQNLGIVTKAAANGSGVILGAGRSNDVPNINPGYAWVGASNWRATAVATSSFYVNSSSFASTAISASHALTASYAINAGAGAGFPYSGSAVITGSLIVSQSVVDFTQATAISGSLFSGSFFGDGTGLTGLGYGDTKKLNQTVAATTWSFSHNMNEQYPTVTVYNDSNEVIQPTKIEGVDAQTLKLYFGVPTAGTAVAVVGGVATTQEAGFNRVYSQTIAANTWSFAHNLGNKYPQVIVYDSNDELVIPGKVEAVDQNNLNIYFDTVQSGTATATVGGTSLTASYANTLIVTDTLLSSQENTDVDTGTETVATVSTTYYDGAFFDYVAKDGTNYRAGTVMAVWDGSSVQYTDNSTADIGDTSGVTLAVDISGTDARLRATVSSDNWNIKAFVRAL